MAKGRTAKARGGATLGFETKLWTAADALRNNMDAAEYKHVVLDLIFLKYISDAFEARHSELDAQKAQRADPEDRNEYRAGSIFWGPKEARWQHLKASAPQSTIGTIVDAAMADVGRTHPPFNDSDWCGELLMDDVRWASGTPPADNANYAWMQHFIHYLAPTGLAGFVLANGSMALNRSGEGEIRRARSDLPCTGCLSL